MEVVGAFSAVDELANQIEPPETGGAFEIEPRSARCKEPGRVRPPVVKAAVDQRGLIEVHTHPTIQQRFEQGHKDSRPNRRDAGRR